MVDTHELKAVPVDPAFRLTNFHVERLFDEFSYDIPMRLAERVTAVVAPNGAGKTICLRLINALFKQRWSLFFDTSFSYLTYDFTDDVRVRVVRSAAKLSGDQPEAPRPQVSLTVTSKDGPEVWEIPARYPAEAVRVVDRYLGFLTRRGRDTWQNDFTRDVFSLPEVFEHFSDQIPERYHELWLGDIPLLLKSIIHRIDCHLIETQRLFILPDLTPDSFYPRSFHSSRPDLTISRKAQKLKEIITADFDRYATLSQSLDRSFPRRVIKDSDREPYADLSQKLQDLDLRRKALMDAGILDAESDEPVALPGGTDLQQVMARFLSIYVDDNDLKLSSLSDLLEKLKLFKKLLGTHFITKEIATTRKNGIEVTHKGHPVPIEALSSGEQHQLVLFFELLFELGPNALILIDEPELSLHVVWQKTFIGDIMEIIKLNKFDVVLATHSPQLISHWSALVVELGNIYGDRKGDNGAEGA